MNQQITPGDPKQIESDNELVRRLLAFSDGKFDSVPDPEPAEEDSFLKRLAKAAEEVLDNWSISLLNARYGIYSENGMSVAEIALRSRMSEEWIDAQLDSILEELSIRGKGDIDDGNPRTAPARLVEYVLQTLRPEESGYERRLLEHAIKEMPSLLGDPMAAYALAAFTTDSHFLLDTVTWASLAGWASEESQNQFDVTVRTIGRHATGMSDLLDAVYWPQNPRRLGSDDYHLIQRIPMRDDEKSGLFFQTIYSEKVGTNFECRTYRELELIDELEHCEEIAYFEQRPFRMPSLEQDSKDKTIVPAFAAILRDGRILVIHLVDPKDLAHEMHGFDALSIRRFCDKHRFGLLVTDGRDTPLSLSRIPLRISRFLSVLTETLQNDLAEKATNFGEASITYREVAGIVARDKRYWVPGTWAVTSRMPDIINVGPVQDS